MAMKRDKVLETILTISMGLVVLSMILHVRVLVGIALIVALVGLFIKPLAERLAWLWMKLAEGLGFVVSRIMLTVVFFLVLLPIALLHRLSAKNHLQLKRSSDASYYYNRDHRYTSSDFENVW